MYTIQSKTLESFSNTVKQLGEYGLPLEADPKNNTIMLPEAPTNLKRHQRLIQIDNGTIVIVVVGIDTIWIYKEFGYDSLLDSGGCPHLITSYTKEEWYEAGMLFEYATKESLEGLLDSPAWKDLYDKLTAK